MNTKVLEKIYKGNVELSEVNVELALIDDLKQLTVNGRKTESGMVNAFLDAKTISQKGLQFAKEHLINLENVRNIVNTMKSQADDLGIDITKVKEWKDGYDFLNTNPKGATDVMIKKFESLK